GRPSQDPGPVRDQQQRRLDRGSQAGQARTQPRLLALRQDGDGLRRARRVLREAARDPADAGARGGLRQAGGGQRRYRLPGSRVDHTLLGLLDLIGWGASTGPPSPPHSETARRSRAAPRVGLVVMGASTGPPSPPRSETARRSRAAPRVGLVVMGASTGGPQAPALGDGPA